MTYSSTSTVVLGGETPDLRPDWAVQFIRAWFGEVEDSAFITIGSMKPGLNKQPRYSHARPETVCAATEKVGIEQLVYPEGEEPRNLYVEVGLKDPEMPLSKTRKGTKKNVLRVPGVWVDLDVDKEGFFRGEEHCLQFLRELPAEVMPTMVVATGTGGVHAYWRCSEQLSGYGAESLCERWWTYLQHRSGVRIDKLTNSDRLMKLPGSVRWPKTVDEPATLVRLLYCNADRTVDVANIERLSRDTFVVYRRSITARRVEVETQRLEMGSLVSDLTGWNQMLAVTQLEDHFNDRYSWEDVLVPLGWKNIDYDSAGRTIWARPGLGDHELHKSAATDYNGSPVMSLFTDSDLTGGLWQLSEAGVALTRYRVYVQCVWKGDERGFIKAYLETIRDDSTTTSTTRGA